jgi:hypothetical protein
MDEREDYYDSLIIDHDVKIVEHMDEASVVVYRKTMIISRKKGKKFEKKRILFIYFQHTDKLRSSCLTFIGVAVDGGVSFFCFRRVREPRLRIISVRAHEFCEIDRS